MVTFRKSCLLLSSDPVMAFSSIMRPSFFSAQCRRATQAQSSLWIRKSNPVSTVKVCMTRRCLATHHARSFAAPAKKASYPQHIYADDLPIISQDTGKVAIGWDIRTWSRLCVPFFLTNTGPQFDNALVITCGCATIVAVQNASIQSPSNVC